MKKKKEEGWDGHFVFYQGNLAAQSEQGAQQRMATRHCSNVSAKRAKINSRLFCPPPGSRLKALLVPPSHKKKGLNKL